MKSSTGLMPDIEFDYSTDGSEKAVKKEKSLKKEVKELKDEDEDEDDFNYDTE